MTVTPVPRPLSDGSHHVAVIAGASGRSVHGPLHGAELPFGLTVSPPGVQFTGLRIGDDTLREAELNRFDTVAMVGVCRLELLTAPEQTALREFVERGGKLILRDSNDSAACLSDARDYRFLAPLLQTTAPPDRNAPALVHLASESPLGSGAIRSKIAQLHVLDVLFTGVVMRMRERALEYTEKTAEAVLDKLY